MPSSVTRRRIASGLVVLAVCVWAALLIVIPLIVAHPPASGVRGVAAAVVYVVGGFVCHQLPERSFHLEGAQVPVCARCAALYWAAPFGLVAALGFARRQPRITGGTSPAAVRRALLLSAIPTLVTLAIEAPGFGTPSNVVRAVAAVPVGLTVTWAVGLFLCGAIRDAAVGEPALGVR